MSFLTTLQAMHAYQRPYGSDVEKAFIARYITPLPGAYMDRCGNWHVVTDPNSKTLWSCHTDTVHRTQGYQTTHYDAATGVLQLSKRSKRNANCLGADDTVGVFLMREMILANVPGSYVFHFGEESGGIGSAALAKANPDWLAQFSRAIALDRGGHTDVVTSQWSQDTASQTFALSLAALLGANYAPHSGVYTDTAEYAHLIPECTNLSVGYFDAHSSNEHVDCGHVLWLLARLIAISPDIERLDSTRDPKAEPVTLGFSWGYEPTQYVSQDMIREDDDRYDWEDYSDDDLETALANAEWLEDAGRVRSIEDEMYARMAALEVAEQRSDRTSAYLDADYADIQRALYRAMKGNYK
jgi:hypothetical protein